jgi:L-threonylcarbamoyladenylate synthase
VTRILRVEARGAIEAASAAIRAGQLVALPTETVYGICCALEPGALERLVAAKGRGAEKGITLLIERLAQARPLAIVSPAATRLAGAFWPGPLTLVLPLRPASDLPALVTGGRDTVGLRVPDMATPRRLARRLGPLPLTSANRSGEPDATDAAAVDRALGDRLALILDGGPSPGGTPSTVVSVGERGETSFEILRPGALSADAIAEALADPRVHF